MTESGMRVVVFGATNRLGRQIWRKALDAGHQVTVYGPSAKELAKETPALRAFQGDTIDAGRIRGAVSGQDAAVVCVGAVWKGVTPDAVTARIVEAMERHDVRRLVVTTSTFDGLEQKSSFWGRLLQTWINANTGRYHRAVQSGDHVPQEGLVRSSSLDWTIVRVPVINDRELGFTERTTNISREEAATFLVRQLDDDSSIHKTLTARGSQSPTAPDGTPPTDVDVAPPTDVAPPQEPPAKGKFDDYPIDPNSEKKGRSWRSR